MASRGRIGKNAEFFGQNRENERATDVEREDSYTQKLPILPQSLGFSTNPLTGEKWEDPFALMDVWVCSSIHRTVFPPLNGEVIPPIDLEKILEEFEDFEFDLEENMLEARMKNDHLEEFKSLRKGYYAIRMMLMKVLVAHGKDPFNDYV